MRYRGQWRGRGKEEGGRAHRSETMYLLSVRNSEVFDNYLFLPISSLTTKVNIIVLLRKQKFVKKLTKKKKKNLSLGGKGDTLYYKT